MQRSLHRDDKWSDFYVSLFIFLRISVSVSKCHELIVELLGHDAINKERPRKERIENDIFFYVATDWKSSFNRPATEKLFIEEKKPIYEIIT